MKVIFFLFIASLFLLFPLSFQAKKATNDITETLKLVILIHRHGDRTPISTYPRDPYRYASFWPDGWGELTIVSCKDGEKGKNRMYNLGRYLGRRYNGFLGSSPLEAYIRSSGSNRCLQSVSLILAGLYPPKSRWMWNEGLGSDWQPFPIQTVPHDFDGLLNPDSYCVKGKQEIENIYNSPTVKQYVNQVQSTLNYVKDNTGCKSMDLITSEEVFDSLLIEKEYNLKLPAWVDHFVYKQLEEISAKTFVFSSMTRLIQRLRTGKCAITIYGDNGMTGALSGDSLLRLITTIHIQIGLLLKEIGIALAKPDFGGKQLYVYSTHDTQLTVLLSALNVYDGLAPPFGSAILLEIHQNQTQEPYLRTFYLNVTESESPFELELKDCPQTWTSGAKKAVCTLTSFRQMVSDLIPGNWEEECGNTIKANTDAISVYILTITLFITICLFIYLFLNNRRHVTLYKMLPVN